MKKVFSKEKFFENTKTALSGISWIEDCDGKTIEECNELGFFISDDWCVEVEDDD